MKSIIVYLTLTLTFFSALGQTTSFTDKQAFEAFTNSGSKSRIPEFHSKETTKGSQFLFNDWVPGNAINKEGQKVEDVGLLFNYDKQHGILYMTKDKITTYALTLSDIRSLNLYNGSLQMEFNYIPAISKTALAQVISSNSSGYSLYKILNTKFFPSNYVTTGITETGHNYDQYIDEPEYYIYKEKIGYKVLPSKRKELKEFFDDNKTATVYLKTHKNDPLNDNFMRELVIIMNKE